MKHWTPEHLAIARAAIDVRDELRRLALTTLPPDAAESIKRCCWLLSHGLKARAPRTSYEGRAEVSTRQRSNAGQYGPILDAPTIEPRGTRAQQEWKR